MACQILAEMLKEVDKQEFFYSLITIYFNSMV